MELCRSNSDNSLGMRLLRRSKAIKFLPVAAGPLVGKVVSLLVFKTTVEKGMGTEEVKYL